MSLFAILILIFLFAGEPDAWDNLHDYAMHVTATPVNQVTVVNKDCK
jgi:hypothetical protein